MKIAILLLCLSTVVPCVCQNSTATDHRTDPDLNAIVATMENVQVKDAGAIKAYQVRREYKVFHGDDIEPISTVQVLITFTRPNLESYVIQKRSGSPRGEKIVRQILDHETESAGGCLSKDTATPQFQRQAPSQMRKPRPSGVPGLRLPKEIG